MDIYCGRNFQEAAKAAKNDYSRIWIISGGLGLVGGAEIIPPYNLSLVRGSPTYIGAHIDGSFDPALWWGQIQRGPQKSPIAELVRSNKEALIAISISSPYVPLISDDLLSLGEADLKRIRVFGLGIESACPKRLQPCVMPYDDRFDGPQSPIPGTRGDFSSRAMRHFAEEVFRENPTGSLEDHKKSAQLCLSGWQRAVQFSRKPLSDEEIIELILQKTNVMQSSASKGLRYLRDVENIACEQGRFSDLFKRAQKQVSE
jgi:hypothetical protein